MLRKILPPSLLLPVLLLLSACGPPLVWVRPNTSTEQAQRDLAQCDNSALREARNYWWPDYLYYGYRPYHDYLFWRQQYEMDRQMYQQHLRDFCMRSRGYHLEALQPTVAH